MQIKLLGYKKLWRWYLVMVLVSILIAATSTSHLSIITKHSSTYFWFRHLLFVLGGLGIVYLFSRMPLNYLNSFYQFADFLYYLSLVLLVMTLFMGVEKGEARRWISIFGFKFQTSEIAKFSMILLAAKDLTRALKNPHEEKSIIYGLFGKMLIMIFAILPNNLSTAAIVAAIITIMVWIAQIDVTLKRRWLWALLILSALGLFLILTTNISIWRSSTWRARIERKFSAHRIRPTDQSIQAKIAIAKGGLINFKPGKSVQKNLISQSYSDYLFSIIVEQFGLVGGAFIIGLYMWLLFLIAQLVSRLKRAFITYTIIGFGVSISLQAFIHILVNVDIFPVTGQPLPFLSLGGTSFLVNSAMIGLMLCASRYLKIKQPKTQVEPVEITFEKTKIITG